MQKSNFIARTISAIVKSLPSSWTGPVLEPYTGGFQQHMGADNPYSPLLGGMGETDVSRISVFAACVLFRGETLSRMCPYETDDKLKGQRYFLAQPNNLDTWPQLFRRIEEHLALWGVAYLLRIRDGRGAVVGLRAVYPSSCVQVADPMTGARGFNVSADVWNGIPQPLMQSTEVVPIYAYRPYAAIMPIRPAELCGLSAKAVSCIEKFGLETAAQMHNLSGILTHPGNINADDAKRVQDYAQRKRAGGILVLGDSMVYTSLQPNAQAAQMIEMHDALVRSVCGVLRVPPWAIGYGGMPGGDASSMQLLRFESVAGTVASLEAALEVAYEMDPGTHIRLDTRSLLRLDPAAQSEEYSRLVLAGVMSANEARDLTLGLPPKPNGDKLYLPSTYQPLGTSAPEPSAGPQDAAPPEPEPRSSSAKGSVIFDKRLFAKNAPLNFKNEAEYQSWVKEFGHRFRNIRRKA